MAQLIEIPLRLGIEEDVDPKEQPIGTLLRGENCRQDKVGRLRKRLGTTGVTTALFGGGDIASGLRISGENGLSITSNESLHAYSETLDSWQTVDRASSLIATQRPLLDTIRSVELVDQALHEELLVTVYMASPSVTAAPIYVLVHEIATGKVVLPPTLVTALGINPRVCIQTSTSTAFILFNDGDATAHIHARSLDLATLALGVDATLPGQVVSGSTFDAQIVGDWLFAARSMSAGVNRIRLTKFDLNDLTFATNTSADTFGAATAGAICIDASSQATVWLAVSFGATTQIVTYDFALVVITDGTTELFAAASSYVFIAWVGGSNALFGFCPASDRYLTTFLVDDTHVINEDSRRLTWHLWSPSKPWVQGNRWHCRALVLPSAAVDASVIVVEIRTDNYTATAVTPPHRHIATLENQTGWYSMQHGAHLTQPAVSGSDVYIAAPYHNHEIVNGVATAIGWNQYKLTLGSDDAQRSIALGHVTLGVGAAPFVTDGATVQSAGFVHTPFIINANAESPGTGSMGAGVYRYVATYAWRDCNGVLHRSIPSDPVATLLASGTSSVTLIIVTTGISCKQDEATGFGANAASPVLIELWRTLADGGEFYRLTLEPDFQVIINDPTVAYITFVDTKGDGNIAGGTTVPLATQPQLYTVQELEDVPPPAFTTATTHRGRFAGIAADRRTVCLSKDIREDPTIFPGFHEALTLVFDVDKYAVGSLDERLVVFGLNNIDLVEGDGPDANGDQNTWRVTGLNTDAGCTNPRSLVVLPAGLMFQNGVDIVLLGRDLSIVWVGRSVADQLAAFPIITSAVLVPSEHEVRFACNDSDGQTGIVLVFDYERKAWYVRKYYDVDSGSESMPIVDAALVNGVYTMMMSSGRVYRETATSFLDADVRYVEMEAEILITPGGKQGWTRVKDVQVLGTSLDNHNLTIQIARDFADDYEQTKVFEAQGDVTSVGPLEKARVTVARQKGEAFRVDVKDSRPTTGGVAIDIGTGEGFMFEGIALNVQPKRGPAKVSAGRKG